MHFFDAIVLMSGGLDSTVALALALSRGMSCLALSFDYGQRHHVELSAAESICKFYSIPQRIISIDPKQFSGSSIVGNAQEVSKGRSTEEILSSGIPSSYVPARNTLFLSYALGCAEVMGASEIHFGMNKMDRGGYPDCRPDYVHAFQNLINLATQQSVDGTPPKLITPLADFDKGEIIALGFELKAPLEMSHSCYSPLGDGSPCGECDACKLREEGFRKYSATHSH